MDLSDRYGRRLVMIWGMALIAASAVIFAIAPHIGFLYAGRLLQGTGPGLAMGAATASLVENNTTINTRFPSSLATVATAIGLTLALVLSGFFAQYAPMPLFWSYIILLALAATAVIALAFTPDDRLDDTPPMTAPGVASHPAAASELRDRHPLGVTGLLRRPPPPPWAPQSASPQRPSPHCAWRFWCSPSPVHAPRDHRHGRFPGAPLHLADSGRPGCHSGQAEFWMISTKFVRSNPGWVWARTSALTLPKVVCGRSLRPSAKETMICSLKFGRG